MLQGNDLLFNCPRCGMPKNIFSLLSGSNIGTTYWSDGYCYSPLFLRNSPVQPCDHCGYYFRIDQRMSSVYADTMSPAPSLLSSAQWLEALNQFKEEDVLSDISEYFMRIHILWAVNHSEELTKEILAPIRTANNHELLRLIYPSNGENLLLRAELYRENGCFDDCQNLLTDPICLNERQKQIASQILAASVQQDTTVFQLTFNQ